MSHKILTEGLVQMFQEVVLDVFIKGRPSHFKKLTIQVNIQHLL